jgi:type IV pilus assembly protein PilA
MVVVLIIAILIAIAIPQFLGARARAQDSAAKSDLRNGLTAAKTLYTDHETYLDTNAATTQADLAGIEPSLKWGTAPSVAESADGQTVCLSEDSKSGTTFSVADVATGASAGTYYSKVACSTDPAVVSGGGSWGDSW